MKKAVTWLVAMVAVLCLVRWSVYAEKQGSAKVTWEYLRVSGHGGEFLAEQRMNELGAQGWELVAVSFGCLGEYSCYSNGYFKRAK